VFLSWVCASPPIFPTARKVRPIHNHASTTTSALLTSSRASVLRTRCSLAWRFHAFSRWWRCTCHWQLRCVKRQQITHVMIFFALPCCRHSFDSQQDRPTTRSSTRKRSLPSLASSSAVRRPNKQTNKQTYKRTNERTNEQRNEGTKERRNEGTKERRNERRNEQMPL